MESPLETEIEGMLAELEPAVESGDAKAMFDSSMLHHDLALRRLSQEHFDSAEHLLEKAVEKGLPEAVEMLGKLETLRYAFEKRLRRRDSNE